MYKKRVRRPNHFFIGVVEKMNPDKTGRQEFIFKNIIENLSEGVLTIDLKGLITYANSVSEQILEIKREDLLDRGFMETFLLYPENDDFNQMVLDAVYKSSVSHNRIVTYFTGEREKTLFVTTSFLKRERGGSVEKIGIIVVLNDITELQELRDAVKAMERIRTLNVQLERRNNFIKEVFGRYISDDVVTTLIEQPEGLKLGGEKRVVSIIISDLRGFTTMSELWPPEVVVSILNNYFSVMTEVIYDYQGTIIDLAGDSLIVVFGAPVKVEDHLLNAVCCALKMQQTMDRVLLWNQQTSYPEIEMGIGINTGPVTLGSFGSEKRARYGLVGSMVNLTSRIESYSVGGQVLASKSVVDKLDNKIIIGDTLIVKPKGIKEAIKIFEIVGIDSPYNLFLTPKREDLLTLRSPLLVKIYTVMDKQCSLDYQSGFIERVSTSEAVMITSKEIPAMNSIKIVLVGDGRNQYCTDDIYANIKSLETHLDANKTEDRYAIRVLFTWISPETKKILQDLVMDE